MTNFPGKPSAQIIETFPNNHPERNYVIECVCPEFTCLCPRTSQPDFATIVIRYVADKVCFELKSLKMYLWSYRDTGVFHETVTNQILNDLVSVINPRWMEVKTNFWVRGGITTSVVAQHGKLPSDAPVSSLNVNKGCHPE